VSLDYRWAETGDLPALNRFVAEHYGPGSIQARPGRLAWLCADHPAGLHVSLCRDGPTIVALCCHLPVTIAEGGSRHAGAFGIDLLVAPAYRRRGIGSRFLQMRLQRFALSLSSGQSAGMAALYRRRGAVRLAAFRRSLFVRRFRLAGRPRELLRDLVARGRSGPSRDPRGRRDETDLDAACRLLAGIDTAPGTDEIGGTIDAPYLRWRYGGPVYGDYGFHRLRDDGGALGLLVSRRAGDTEILTDLVCAPAERPALLRLAGLTSPAARLVALTAGTGLAEDLGAAGFLVRPTEAEVVAASADTELVSRLAGRRWRFFAGDSDVDLIREPGVRAAAT
jgi:GNAT superfamily N-acetyltransferase